MNAPARTATLQTLKSPPPSEASLPSVAVGFGSLQSFELTQRIAKLFSSSTLVPVQYRHWVQTKDKKGWEENPSALSNCCIAINMAERLHADPLMVMQNLHIIEGRPGWSAVWIIASINQCGRFEPLRFDMSAPSEPREIAYEYSEWEGPQGNRKRVTKTKTVKVIDRTCIAWTVPKGTIIPPQANTLQKAKDAGLTVYESTPVSIDLAIKEGWYQRNGSKWQTMSDQMLVYRSAAFFGRVYAPELLLGLPSEDEVHDILTARRNDAGTFEVMDIGDLRPPAEAAVDDGSGDPGATIDQETGEIQGATTEAQPAQAQAEQPQVTQAATATADDRQAFEDACKKVQTGEYDDARAICPPAQLATLEKMIENREANPQAAQAATTRASRRANRGVGGVE